jgi:phthalate 3,4-dioxygenase ferredoxin reductase subunit
MSRTVIVGASVGGVRTAQGLRAKGYDGEIVLVDSEDELPYDKPPLSKDLLAGGADAESIRLLDLADAARLRLELVLGEAACSLDTRAKVVELAKGGSMRYDRLVIATGARARRPPWGRRAGIHVVRTLADTRALRRDLLPVSSVVVIGGGFIGAEVAATVRQLGRQVVLVDPSPVPMARALEAALGQEFTALHQAHGVVCRFGVGVRTIDGAVGAFTVHLSDGSAVDAELVVVGIGAEPNTDWLRDSGLSIEDGVVCDEYCRAVGVQGVYAVGDVARWWHPERGGLVRAEHWTNAVDQAACVAHNLVAPEDLRAYAPVEYVWTDQYDWRVQVIGRTRDAAYAERVGDAATGRFAALYAAGDGSLSGAVVVCWPKALVLCRRAVRSRSSLDEVLGTLAALPRPVAARVDR